MILSDKTAKTDDVKAKLFADFLSSVYVNHYKDNDLLNFINNRNDDGCLKIEGTRDMVHHVLSTLDLKKGMGLDQVSPFVLRECADQLAGPLSIIYLKSLSYCIVPDKFKIGQIVPIHKSDNRNDVEKYRGVNVMPN